MKNKVFTVALIAVAFIAIVALVAAFAKQAPPSGAIGTRFPDGLSVGTLTSPTGKGFYAAGTTTIDKSFDGFIAFDTFDMTSTTTVQASYTNTNGPLLCDGAGSAIWADGTTFAPSIQVSLATSTSATSYTSSGFIIATTTLATTTDTLLPGAYKFILGSGQSIIGLLDDNAWATASSTYWGQWAIQFRVPCSLIGG